MERSGLRREDYDCEIIEVFPENWQAFRLFCDLQTQWRGAGMVRIGLDYNTLFHKMDRMGLSAAQYEDMEGDIRVMETGALIAMRKNQGP